MKARILILLTAIVILSGCAVTLTEFEDLQGRVEKLENQTGVEPYSKVDNTKRRAISRFTKTKSTDIVPNANN